jgi:hypothetical protein
MLADDLCSLLSESAEVVQRTEYGTKYIIRGRIMGPSARTFGVTTV